MLVDSVIALCGSGLLGAGLKIFAARQKAVNDLIRSRIEGVTQLSQAGDEKYRSTRRTIAFAAVASVMVLPKVAYLFDKSTVVYYGMMQNGSSFLWGLFSESPSIIWYAVPGYVITPVDVIMMYSIAGFYLGASVVGNMLK